LQQKSLTAECFPMTTFDDREKAFENMFAHDAEIRFKVEARARNLLALWGAHRMGLNGDEAVGYAKSVLMAWMAPHPADAAARVKADLETKGITVGPREVEAKLLELKEQAFAQVKKEG
jgi:hypothetical protein